eukprot:c5294_g1_i2.p1 GENE.c5294_g1_i2~~c5294_g1_i2.p1  ORF type:complete len:953 (-),score=291.12 c5294_g1_i2:22-2880(-)
MRVLVLGMLSAFAFGEAFDCITSCRTKVGDVEISFLEIGEGELMTKLTDLVPNVRELRQKCLECTQSAHPHTHFALPIELHTQTAPTVTVTDPNVVTEDSDTEMPEPSNSSDNDMTLPADTVNRPLFGTGCADGEGSSAVSGEPIAFPLDSAIHDDIGRAKIVPPLPNGLPIASGIHSQHASPNVISTNTVSGGSSHSGSAVSQPSSNAASSATSSGQSSDSGSSNVPVVPSVVHSSPQSVVVASANSENTGSVGNTGSTGNTGTVSSTSASSASSTTSGTSISSPLLAAQNIPSAELSDYSSNSATESSGDDDTLPESPQTVEIQPETQSSPTQSMQVVVPPATLGLPEPSVTEQTPIVTAPNTPPVSTPATPTINTIRAIPKKPKVPEVPLEEQIGVPSDTVMPASGPGLDTLELSMIPPPKTDDAEPFAEIEPPKSPEHHIEPPMPQDHRKQQVVDQSAAHQIRTEPSPSPSPISTVDPAWIGESEPAIPETPCERPILPVDYQEMPDNSPITFEGPAGPREHIPTLPTGGEWKPQPLELLADNKDSMKDYQIFGMLHTGVGKTYDAIMERSADWSELMAPVKAASAVATNILSRPRHIVTPDVVGETEAELNARASWAFMNVGDKGKVRLPEEQDREQFETELREQEEELARQQREADQEPPQPLEDTSVVPPPPAPPTVATTVVAPEQITPVNPILEDSHPRAPILSLTGSAVITTTEPVTPTSYSAPIVPVEEVAVAVEEENRDGQPIDMRRVTMATSDTSDVNEPTVIVESEDDMGLQVVQDEDGKDQIVLKQPERLFTNLRNADGQPLIRPKGVFANHVSGQMMTEYARKSEIMPSMPHEEGCAATASHAGMTTSVNNAVISEAAPMILPDHPCQQRFDCNECVGSSLCVWCPALEICVVGGVSGAISRFNCHTYSYGTCDSTVTNPLIPRVKEAEAKADSMML